MIKINNLWLSLIDKNIIYKAKKNDKFAMTL